MKSKILPLVLCCLIATSVYAHREDYFSFTMGDNPANDGWSVSGGTGEADAGLYGIIADGNKPVIWQRDLSKVAGEKVQPYVSRAILRFISGTEAGGASHVVPKVVLIGETAGDSIMFTFKTAPDDDSKTVSDTSTIVSGAAFTGNVRYIKVVFENVKKDEYVSFNYINLASQWFIPQVNIGQTIYVQAEDYDESWINKRKAYSPIAGGNLYRPADADLYIAWQDDGAFFQSWTYGNGHKDDWYGRAVKNMCPNGGTWQTYSGDYVDATSNKITVANATKNWGAWLEYTFDVSTDCYADISLKAGSHWGAYAGVSGGTGKYGKARADGGYVVEGINEDWTKRYCASVVVSLDGNNLMSNWSAYPQNNGYSQLEYAAVISDPTTGWKNTQILKNGVLVNSDTLHIFPDPRNNGGNMMLWSTYYKSDLFQDLKNAGSDDAFTPYIKPDYANVPLTKGRHTIKVQSLAPMWHFDEMKIVPKSGATGLDVTNADNKNNLIVFPSVTHSELQIQGANVSYTIIDLRTGAEILHGFGNKINVSGLSAGVYAIRANGNVQRFIKK